VFSLDFLIELELPTSFPIQFDSKGEMEVHYDLFVRSGPPIDILILTRDEFEFYKNGDRFKSIHNSTEIIEVSGKYPVQRGSYIITLSTRTAGKQDEWSGSSKIDADITGVLI
jgi:hypothetical protein